MGHRASITLRFREISPDEMRAGPGPDNYDIFPLDGISYSRSYRSDFTLPIDQTRFSIFLRADDAAQVSGLDDLAGLEVGMLDGVLWDRIAQENEQFTSVRYEDRDTLLEVLTNGEVDAALFSTRDFQERATALGAAGDIRTVEPPFFANGLAPALRPGLGVVRARLDAVIPGFLVSDEYKALREAWFGDQLFWTQASIRTAVVAVVMAFGALVGTLIWQLLVHLQRQRRFRRNKAELEREQQHSDELAKLVAELERSNSDLNDFAYIASHDLKEPLRGITINADFLLREDVSKEVRQRVDRMVELASRMQQLISDLLFFSRLGRDEKDFKTVDLISVIDGLLIDLRETLEEKGGTIVVVSDLPPVRAEVSRIKTILQNLIMNGLIYNDATAKSVEIGFEPEIKIDGKLLRDVFFLDATTGSASKKATATKYFASSPV